jgi:hypothetical protein
MTTTTTTTITDTSRYEQKLIILLFQLPIPDQQVYNTILIFISHHFNFLNITSTIFSMTLIWLRCDTERLSRAEEHAINV